MFSAIKLVILENGKMLDSITKETSTQSSQLIKSLDDFQQSANAMLTKLIETQGGSADNNSDDAEEEDEKEDEDEQVSPKKKRK